MGGNIKDDHEDEVADWVDEQEASNYHTVFGSPKISPKDVDADSGNSKFTIPYGEKFHAKKVCAPLNFTS